MQVVHEHFQKLHHICMDQRSMFTAIPAKITPRHALCIQAYILCPPYIFRKLMCLIRTWDMKFSWVSIFIYESIINALKQLSMATVCRWQIFDKDLVVFRPPKKSVPTSMRVWGDRAMSYVHPTHDCHVNKTEHRTWPYYPILVTHTFMHRWFVTLFHWDLLTGLSNTWSE